MTLLTIRIRSFISDLISEFYTVVSIQHSQSYNQMNNVIKSSNIKDINNVELII